MLKDISGIRLKGANFTEHTTLQLFVEGENCKPSISSRICLLYGKNGSGKSTIAKGFENLCKDDDSTISSELINVDGNTITLTDEEKNKIYVFNELFVDEQVRFSEEGLETVVMLGETGALNKKLADAKTELQNAEKAYNEKKDLNDRFLNEKDIFSPAFWLKEMGNRLRGGNNWAERDLKIKEGDGQRRATSVSDESTYKQFICLNPKETRDELIIEFDHKLQELNVAKGGQRRIEKPAEIKDDFHFNEEAFLSILAVKLEEPNLSEREQFLLTLLETRKLQHLQDIHSYFSDSNNKICPFCLQDVSNENRVQLITSIKKILNDAIEIHRTELQSYECKCIDLDLSLFEPLNKEVVKKCQVSLDSFNEAIRFINEKIEVKLDNIYNPIIVDSIDINKKYEDLKIALKELEQSRIAFNKNATDVLSIKKRLNEINADIAYYDIHDAHEMYLKQCGLRDCEATNLQTASDNFSRCKKIVLDLESQIKNVEIAMSKINRWLQYIFYDKNRLTLEFADNKYYIKVKGESVTPRQISSGERNAIALCYFFSKLMQGKSEKDVYKEPFLIIIDDPISSFDIENRVGVLSFLKYQLKNFVLGNIDTKAVIMTHDIQAFFDIEKFTNEIIQSCKNHFSPTQKPIFSHLELSNRNLLLFRVKDRQEYSNLLKDIFEYASTGNIAFSPIIGNMMRRVLEAFGSFVYKKGIEKITTNDKILSELDPCVVPYFENFLYRLVLNGESHMQERVRSLSNLDFFEYISDYEKQKTAKDLICFLYCLNKNHVLEHLDDENGSKEKIIESWINDIKSQQ